MTPWRTLGAVVVMLASARLGPAQTYMLAERLQAGDCFRVHLDMNLTGEIHVQKDGKVQPLKLSASAAHEFLERLLNVGVDHLGEKSARYYEKARAAISVDGEDSKRTLRPERRLLVAQRHQDRYLVYSPAGSLNREEMELTNEHFDTLCLAGLLPGRAVALGETWKIPNPVVQALCGFGGLVDQSLVCKLESVQDQQAHLSVSGMASGIDTGSLAKVTIEGSCDFDLKTQRLVRVEWKQKDDRDQGPASPAAALATTTVLTRTPIEQPETLTDVALVSVPDGFDPPAPLTQLEYHDPKKRYDMLYGRDWQLVSQTDEHLVLRLIQRGDFIAQATVTPWTKAPRGKHLTADEFREAMNETPGWSAEQELQASEVPTDGGRWIYRISATGQLDGMKVLQNFDLLASPDGDQVVLTFTLTPKQADNLGTNDLSMASSIDFPGSHQDAGKQK